LCDINRSGPVFLRHTVEVSSHTEYINEKSKCVIGKQQQHGWAGTRKRLTSPVFLMDSGWLVELSHSCLSLYDH